MFIKGLKYEFRAVARIVLPLFIVFLCFSMLMSAGFMLDGRVFHLLESEEHEVLSGLAILATFIFSLGILFLIVAINIAVFVMIVHRFYVSFFTDEGYLTFTLPLTMDCHLMIKIVSMFLWSLLSWIVTALGVFVIFGGVSFGYPEIFKEVISKIPVVIWDILTSIYPPSLFWIGAISLILTSVFQSFLLYFSITLGCMIFKKNRLLGAIISVFCIDIIFSVLTSFSSSMVNIFSVISETAAVISYVISIVFAIVGIIASYCATKHILERKLNLD